MAGCTGYSDEAIALYNNGVSLGKLGQYEEALAAFDQALKINPGDADAWRNKGAVLAELGRYEEALAAVNQALKINPGDADAKWISDNLLNYLKT